jgi:hypothetical protein
MIFVSVRSDKNIHCEIFGHSLCIKVEDIINSRSFEFKS